jgi:di/tricarboxylate transporter
MNKLADEKQTISKPGIISPKQIIAAVLFAALAMFLATVVPSIEIAWVSAILVFALTVAIATSNSFLILTHQVNALIMGPGGYT